MKRCVSTPAPRGRRADPPTPVEGADDDAVREVRP